MKKNQNSHDDWSILLSMFPKDWRSLGESSDATNYMRGFASPEALIRTLLLHIGKGYSLKETATRAALAGLSDVSHVALFKRLKKSEQWLRLLCLALVEENGIDLSKIDPKSNFRIVDGSIVREQGKTGSEWRFLFSMRLPSLDCDFFDLTSAKGAGTGESLSRLKVNRGDHILGDRVYAISEGVAHVSSHGGFVLVRTNGVAMPFYGTDGKKIDVHKLLVPLTEVGKAREWAVIIKDKKGRALAGRLCAIRKSELEIQKAFRKLKLRESRKQYKLKSATVEFSKFIMVFTTFSEEKFDATQIMELYRLRWQIELAIKRLKSLVKLGHIPKNDDSSCRAWLYGKLFLGLLTEKLARIGRAFSPWGYHVKI